MENSASTKVSNQQILAKKYIEENDIEKIISEMLNSLVHEKAKQPVVYMIKYLAGLLSEQERKDYGLIIPDPFPKGKPIVKYPDLEKSDCILKRYLNRNVWTSMKYNKTKNGGNIMNVIKPSETNSEDKVGCVLVDGSTISTFNTIFEPLLAELHNLQKGISNLNEDKPNVKIFKPQKEFTANKSKTNASNFPFHERLTDRVNKISFSYSRNLQDFPYSAIISHEKRKQVEENILRAIKNLNEEKILKEGKYLTYNTNEKEIKDILNEIQFNEAFLRTAELKTSWPDNRGVFSTKDKDIIILINFIDHLQLIVTAENNSDFSAVYNYSKDLIQSLERNVNFDIDKFYGYLNVNPLLIGSGLMITSEISLNNLPKINEFQKTLNNFNFDTVISKDSILFLKSYCKLSYEDEVEFVEDYYNKISGFICVDKDKENIGVNFNFNKLTLDDKTDKAIYEAYNNTYEDLKYVISPSGMTINSLVRLYQENPANVFGIIMTEQSDYKTFHKFIKEYLRIRNDLLKEKLSKKNNPEDLYTEDGYKILEISHPDKVVSCGLCLIRNISEFSFPTSKNSENIQIEDLILKALHNINMKGFVGKYTALQDEKVERIIQDNNPVIFKNSEYEKYGINRDFPKNRGLIIFENFSQTGTTVYAVINDHDHIKFQINLESTNINKNAENIFKVSNEFAKHLKFLSDKEFGFLTASPKFLGTGMITKSILRLINLTTKRDLIEEVLNLKNFSYRILNESEGLIEISNLSSIARSESELIINLISVIDELTELDELKIFRTNV